MILSEKKKNKNYDDFFKTFERDYYKGKKSKGIEAREVGMLAYDLLTMRYPSKINVIGKEKTLFLLKELLPDKIFYSILNKIY